MLESRSALAMFLVVWAIYLTDRIIDVARCANWQQATGRLRFGRRHRHWFRSCLVFCAVGFLTIVFLGLPVHVMLRGAGVAIGVLMYFLLFVVPIFLGRKLPGKEFGVGLFFALGAFTCLGGTVATMPMFVAVAVLVAYNCLVIAAKDADSDQVNDPGGASRWWMRMNRDLIWVGIVLIAVEGLAAILCRERAFYISVTTAFLGLTILHRNRRHFGSDDVRALADYALLTPIPVQVGIVLFSGR